ncbi:sugar kinase [Streptomyces vilmorinianum]|uniref:sugar kinase n=1 Tax=Streptomyces vilmorinianum TaxID=3051092 RepID=UPI0024E11971|nr:sugar kinase [Streptomyces vilmorinianum]
MTGNPPVDASPVDVVCLGESMVTFLPSRPGRLADVPSFTRAIGGAESNVACALAAAGHRVKWVGRVGADGFGDHLVEAIGAYGVDVSAVARDAGRPTGVYFRTATDRAAEEHEVVYFRAGSAASAMSPATVPYESVAEGRILHLSGITAALSDDCLALMRELTASRPDRRRPLVSFDVNFRAGLWREGGAEGARVLLELARGADLVFVGEDEAEEAWGVAGPEAVREALPEPPVVVVKRGARGAVVFERRAGSFPARPLPEPGAPPPDPRTSISPYALRRGGTPSGAGYDTVTDVPAPRVDVVAPVGAGDAFAAGFLSGTLRGLDVTARVRHGHLMAAAALTVPGDLATPPPTPVHADRLVALDDEGWGRLHLGPGWTRTGQDQEVRTS